MKRRMKEGRRTRTGKEEGRKKAKKTKTKNRAEHVAVKGVADGIIGSFLSPCTTRPRFSFTSTSCHFVLARDGYRVTYSFVCAHWKFTTGWSIPGNEVASASSTFPPTGRNFLREPPPPPSPPPPLPHQAKFIFPPTYIYLNSPLERCGPRELGWLLIFCKRRRPLCEILLERRNANTVFNIKNEKARLMESSIGEWCGE